MQNKDFLKKIWLNIQIKMQNFMNNKNFYENFFLKTTLVKVDGKTIILEAPTEYAREIIEKEYLEKIEQYFLEAINENLKVRIFSKENKFEDIWNEDLKIDQEEDNFDYRLTFKNYVVGEFNKTVYKAAQNILINKNNIYNPFLIYGDTGLGKTHIINAMGIKFKEQGLKVKFINSEDFIREACKYLPDDSKGVENFKDEFDKYDVLIIDDIQFISNKNKINELFFTIFNRYMKSNKRIIMSSDKLPNELKIDNRMISRLNSGLTIQIKKVDMKTIYEIIKLKIAENINNIKFTDNAISYIANRFNSDIRSLEGVINKIIFQVSLMDEQDIVVDQEKIKLILEVDLDNNLLNKGYYTLSPNTVIENICIAYSINKNLVTSKKRKKDITFVRKICIYVLREKMDLSYAEIGTYFSNRDHSTVLEAYKSIKEQINQDEDLKKFIDSLIKNI
ncbi:MAG: chromosomal replication initiator protein DnaA [Mycoplasmoidaceae bacterium]